MSAIALDPLIAEAKQRARRRRVYLVLALVAVAAAGGVFWRFTGGGDSTWPLPADTGSTALASARFPGYGLSFRYPANWKRLDCVQQGSFTSTLTYLTNAPSAVCPPSNENESSGAPPVNRLGADGILVDWSSSPAGYGYTANPQPEISMLPGRSAVIGGMGARIETLRNRLVDSARAQVCVGDGASVVQVVPIQRPGVGSGDWLTVTGCFRGPDVSANTAAFRRMLSSVRLAQG